MRKPSKVLTVLALLATLVVALLMLGIFLFREPKYEGKTAREWIYLLDPHVDQRAQHDRASEALARIGAAAIPTIRDILQTAELTPVHKLKLLAQRYRLLPPDSLELAERQYRASRAAYKIAEDAGADISSLVPLLSFHLTNSNYADTENGRALAHAGPQGIAVLTNLASHPNTRIRDRAVVSLQHARAQPGVFETFLRTVNDPDQSIRFSALSSLSRYPQADPALLVPLGLKSIQSTNQYDRWAAARLLAAFSSDSRAVQALTQALADPDQNVRSTAARALERLRSASSPPP